jgi:hypothetical protein
VVSVFVHYVSQLEPSAQRTHGKHQARPRGPFAAPLLCCVASCPRPFTLPSTTQVIANRSDVSLLHYKVPQEVPYGIYTVSVSLLVGR